MDESLIYNLNYQIKFHFSYPTLFHRQKIDERGNGSGAFASSSCRDRRRVRGTCKIWHNEQHVSHETCFQTFKDKFVAGEIEVDEFLEQFLTRRKLMHMRKVKVDKMKEIMRKASVQSNPGYPVTNNFPGMSPSLPYPTGIMSMPMPFWWRRETCNQEHNKSINVGIVIEMYIYYT